MRKKPEGKPGPSLNVSRKSLHIRKPKKETKVKDVALHVKGVPDVNGAQIIKTTSDVQLKQVYVTNAVAQFHKSIKDNVNKNELFDEDKPVYLQVGTVKIPKCPSKTLSINLKHGLLSAGADIILITADLKNEKTTDYEKNVEHYRAVLERHGITCVKEIVPLHQLKAQYTEFEMQTRLIGQYDMFICDTKVSSYVKKLMGHMIQKRNKLFHNVKLQVTNLKGTFDKLMLQTQMDIHPEGCSYSMYIGHTGMTESQLVDNIMAAANELEAKLPGGFMNIQGLFIKTALGKAIQFYVSCIHSSNLKVPVVERPKSKTNVVVKGELSTEMDAIVTVLPSGAVLLKSEIGEDGEKIADKELGVKSPKKKKNFRQAKTKPQTVVEEEPSSEEVPEEQEVTKEDEEEIKVEPRATRKAKPKAAEKPKVEKRATALKRKIENKENVGVKKAPVKKSKKTEETPDLNGSAVSEEKIVTKKKAATKDTTASKTKAAKVTAVKKNGTVKADKAEPTPSVATPKTPARSPVKRQRRRRVFAQDASEQVSSPIEEKKKVKRAAKKVVK